MCAHHIKSILKANLANNVFGSQQFGRCATALSTSFQKSILV